MAPELPDWIFRFRSTSDLATFIIATIATWIVASIFDLWSAILGYIEGIYVAASWVVVSVANVIAGVFSPVWGFFAALEGIYAGFTATLMGLGVAAPVAAVVFWLVIALWMALLLSALTDVADTYLPVGWIPVLGRWF